MRRPPADGPGAERRGRTKKSEDRMPTDQRKPHALRRLDSARLTARAAGSVASLVIAAGLWVGAGSAVAMSARGPVGPGIGFQHQGRAIGNHVATGRSGTATSRRLRIVRLPPGEGDPGRHPPHRPHWPHHPILGGLPLQPPPAPPGLADLPPGGPPGGAANGGNSGGTGITTPAANEQRFVPDQILVSFAASTSPQAIVGFAQTQRLALLGIHRLPAINAVLYQFRVTDRRAVPAVLGSLRGDARIGSAQPNFLYTLQDAVAPAPAGDPAQYVVAKLHLGEAHAFATGAHVLVAVIDSAIDTAHPELQGTVSAGFDAIGGVPLPHQHGTAMASAIAAHRRLVGVAPAAHILAIRAFGGAGATAQGLTTRVLDGLQRAADAGARVANMSFTGPADPKLHEMIASLRQKGMVPVAAAGNDGPNAPPDYPAAYPEVIAVTATDVDDKLLRVANHGSYVAVAAPGVDIFVAAPNGRYDFSTGTSVATAHVSGLAALLLDRSPALTPDAVQDILMRTAKDLGPKGRDDAFGAGLIDAYEALLALAPETARAAVH
jgi:Subtilase family